MAQVSGVQVNLGRLERHCLVTIGATARFPQLLAEVASPDFLEHMHLKGYTHVHVQCGVDHENFAEAINKVDLPKGQFHVLPFAFVDELRDVMVLCRAAPGLREQGVIISHAGTGTVLDAWRVGASLIIVPNRSLKDDHQTELAQELQDQGYAIWGHLGNLRAAVEEVERLRDEQQNRWRPHSVSEELTKVNIWGAGKAMHTRYMTDAQIAAINSSKYLPNVVATTPSLASPEADDQVTKEEAAKMALD